MVIEFLKYYAKMQKTLLPMEDPKTKEGIAIAGGLVENIKELEWAIKILEREKTKDAIKRRKKT